jgi:hypothetical protein
VDSLPNLRIAPRMHPLQCQHMPDNVLTALLRAGTGKEEAIMSDIHPVDARAGARAACPGGCVLARKGLHRRAFGSCG